MMGGVGKTKNRKDTSNLSTFDGFGAAAQTHFCVFSCFCVDSYLFSAPINISPCPPFKKKKKPGEKSIPPTAKLDELEDFNWGHREGRDRCPQKGK